MESRAVANCNQNTIQILKVGSRELLPLSHQMAIESAMNMIEGDGEASSLKRDNAYKLGHA